MRIIDCCIRRFNLCEFQVGILSISLSNNLATTSFDETTTIAIYPNPVTQLLNIHASKPMNRIKIFDVSGKLIYDLKQKSETINTDWSHYSNGVYFISIYDDNGFIVKKVIKQ